MLQREKT
jgi:hypothetical protein